MKRPTTRDSILVAITTLDDITIDRITLVAFLNKKPMPHSLAAAVVVFYAFYQTHHINDYDDYKARLGQRWRPQAELGDRSAAAQNGCPHEPLF